MYDLYMNMRDKKVNTDLINSQAEFYLVGFFFDSEYRRTYQELWGKVCSSPTKTVRRVWTLFWESLSCADKMEFFMIT